VSLNLAQRVGAAVSLAAVAAAMAACAGGVTGPLRNADGTGVQLGAASPESVAPIHTVTGSGRLVLPGVDAQLAASARLLADGTATGVFTMNAHDLSAFGAPGHTMLQFDVDCLEFDGTRVWFSGPIKHTTLPPPPGGGPHPPSIGLIVDAATGDRIYVGPAPPGVTCHDKPSLPELPVDGDFRVE